MHRLDRAFAAFFRRVQAGERPGYPRFRSCKRFDTVDFPKDGNGCRWDATPHDPKVSDTSGSTSTGRWSAGSRRSRSSVRASLVRRPDRETGPARAACGDRFRGRVDMGIANFRADSDGGFVSNPRHGWKAAARLEAAQQLLSRCKRAFPRCRPTACTRRSAGSPGTGGIHSKIPAAKCRVPRWMPRPPSPRATSRATLATGTSPATRPARRLLEADVTHWLSYSSWRRHQWPVSLRPRGARSSHWYMPHRASSPRA